MALLKRAIVLLIFGTLTFTGDWAPAYSGARTFTIKAKSCISTLTAMESSLNKWMTHFKASYPTNSTMKECIDWVNYGGDGGTCTSGSAEWKEIKKETQFISKAMSVCNSCKCPKKSVMIQWMYEGGFPRFKNQLLDSQDSGEHTAEVEMDNFEEDTTYDYHHGDSEDHDYDGYEEMAPATS